MLQDAPMEHSAILVTFINETNFGLLFEWPLKAGFTVLWQTVKIKLKCHIRPYN